MIKPISIEKLPQAIALVNRVFSEFVAPTFPPEGQKTFEDYLAHKEEDLTQALTDGSKKMWGYYENDTLLGVISVRDHNHISLLFVDKAYHKRGIATKMVSMLQDELKKDDICEMTVHSSPYAVHIYEKMGFKKLSEQVKKDGICYTPMKKIF